MYFALQKCYPTREQYGDTLLFCRHCSTLFWKVSCGRGRPAGRDSLPSAWSTEGSKQEAMAEACGAVCPRRRAGRFVNRVPWGSDPSDEEPTIGLCLSLDGGPPCGDLGGVSRGGGGQAAGLLAPSGLPGQRLLLAGGFPEPSA